MRGYDLIIIKDITEGGIGEVEGGWGDGAVSAREMAFEEGLEVRAKVPSPLALEVQSGCQRKGNGQ